MPRKRNSIKKETKLLVFNKYNKKCAYCGCDLVMTKKESLETGIANMQIDHLIAFRNRKYTVEELDHIDNLMPSCQKCNFYKKAKSLETYRKFLKELHTRIENTYCVYMGKKYGLIEKINKWNGIFYFELKENLNEKI